MLDSALVGIVATGLGAAALLALLQYVIGRQPPKKLAGDHGTMHPNDSMIAVGILIAAGVGCASIFYCFLVASSLPAIVIAVAGLASVPVLATAFSSIYDISWDTTRITGPSTTWYSPFGTERRDIHFEDLVAAGEDKWGNYFVESSDGTRICWNWFYNGYPELMYFVEDMCPHLFPEDDASDDAEPVRLTQDDEMGEVDEGGSLLARLAAGVGPLRRLAAGGAPHASTAPRSFVGTLENRASPLFKGLAERVSLLGRLKSSDAAGERDRSPSG